MGVEARNTYKGGDELAASIRPCANDPLFLPVPLKGGGTHVVFGL